MNESLKKLQEIGAQKIYETTHIPAGHVQAILHENYDSMNKIQFVGFISILEREYHLDLSSVKQKGIAYFNGEQPQNEESIFVNVKPKKNYKIIYLLIAVVIFFVVFFMYNSHPKQEIMPVVQEHEIIKQVQEKVIQEVNTTQKSDIVDENTTSELLNDVPENNETVEIPEASEEHSLTIKTDKKLWLGYIELKTNKKNQTSVSKEFSLDPDIDWLLTTGHGYVEFDINGEKYSFHEMKGLKLLYKDGALKKLTLKEFKRLNRGYVW